LSSVSSRVVPRRSLRTGPLAAAIGRGSRTALIISRSVPGHVDGAADRNKGEGTTRWRPER